MNVTLVTPHLGLNDGQGRVNYEIVRRIASPNCEITLLATLCAPEIAALANVTFIPLTNCELPPTQLLKNLAFAASSTAWIARNRRNIDILHVNGGVTWSPSDINSVHFVHGAWITNENFPFPSSWRGPYALYQRLYSAVSAAMELPSFRSARNVVAVSKKVSSELQSIGVPSEKISIIYNGVDTEEFAPGMSDRSAFRLPEHVPVFLFAGDIRTRRKNLDTALIALSQVPGVHLAVAGETMGSPFPSLAAELGLKERVHFLGQVKHMASLMRSVDAFVFPSRYECMSLAILEALASGLPVITAITAGGAEVVGEAGKVIDDPNDSVALAYWMHQLASNPRLRMQMSFTARQVAIQLNWDRMAAAYLGLYNQVKNSRVPSSTEARIPSRATHEC